MKYEKEFPLFKTKVGGAPKKFELSDPEQRKEYFEAKAGEEIKKLKDQGVTIFLTTHYMDEADKLCDNIAIIDNGTIIAKGTPEELKDGIGADRIELCFSSEDNAKNAAALLSEKMKPASINHMENTVHLYIKNGEGVLPEILRTLDSKNLIVQNVTLSKPSLDDVFLKYTGRSLREDAN